VVSCVEFSLNCAEYAGIVINSVCFGGSLGEATKIDNSKKFTIFVG
jgi:hypothetical protein